MMRYSKVCDQDHEAETMSVEAENDDEAMDKMMGMVKAHMAEKHDGMELSDEDLKSNIASTWTKEEMVKEENDSDEDDDDEEDKEDETSDDDDEEEDSKI